METNILLESGTNELEILEFRVGGNYSNECCKNQRDFNIQEANSNT